MAWAGRRYTGEQIISIRSEVRPYSAPGPAGFRTHSEGKDEGDIEIN